MTESTEYKKLEPGFQDSWDETDRRLTQMGYFGWRPRFLECLNTPAFFAMFFALGNLTMVMSYGIFSLIIPVLEEVFNLNSKQTGVILMANDISGMIVALLIANYCSARKVRWIGMGMLMVCLSAIIPASTTLYAEYPQPRNVIVDEIVLQSTQPLGNQTLFTEKGSYGVCKEMKFKPAANGPVSTSDESEDYAVRNHKYYWFFVLGSLLQGAGNAPPRVAGSTYMDEIFTQKQFGVAISVLYVVSFLGYPAIMMLGGIFLQIYVTLDPPEGITPSSNEWVGAWWMGLFFPAVFVFFFSFIVLLYPRQMPAAKKVLQEKVERGITTVQEKKEELRRSLKEVTKDMIPAFKRLIKNQALNFLIVGDIFMMLSVGAYSYYPKLYVKIFRLNYKDLGLIQGVSNIIGFGLGLIGSGVLMRVKKWEPKRLQLVYSVITALAIPFTFGVLIYCPTDTLAGVDISYPHLLNTSQLSPPTLTGECNSECACTTAFYQPVCDGDVTFFSPCHAGCYEVELNKTTNKVVTYSNCTCAASGTAVPGTCGTQCPGRMFLSITITSIGTIIGFAGFAAHTYIYQRVVGEVDRTFTQGIRSSVTRALGTLPAPILFGWVIDKFCTVWKVSEDGTTGNCWVYDLDNLILWFCILRVVIRSISSVCYFLAWWVFPENKVVQGEGGETKEEDGEDCRNGEVDQHGHDLVNGGDKFTLMSDYEG
ncbi:hypothetical protein ACHWQZ_G001337 [Mnemiopsis leidyi]